MLDSYRSTTVCQKEPIARITHRAIFCNKTSIEDIQPKILARFFLDGEKSFKLVIKKTNIDLLKVLGKNDKKYLPNFKWWFFMVIYYGIESVKNHQLHKQKQIEPAVLPKLPPKKVGLNATGLAELTWSTATTFDLSFLPWIC